MKAYSLEIYDYQSLELQRKKNKHSKSGFMWAGWLIYRIFILL